MSSSDRPDYVQQNVANWTRANTDYTDDSGSRAWAQEEITWGVFETPESELNLLGDVNGLDVVELGCGTAYFSSWLARRGATVVGVDPTPAQLETARRLQGETGIEFPLVEAAAESVPLPDASFDLAVSEYGASLWAVPERWIAEAARLLRPGGRLVFMTNSNIAIICSPDTGDIDESLHIPLVGLYRNEWPDEVGVEYHLPHSKWIDLLHASGFQVERLIDVYATADSKRHDYYGYVSVEWARKWPVEEIWTARKR